MRRHIFLLPTIIAAFILPLPGVAAEKVNLPVPFVWEIPGGVWIPPWSGACEEASIVMVENFYLGRTSAFTRSQMKNLMWPLFTIQDRLFGSNLDSNSTRTLQIINDYSSFDASIVVNPGLDEIKSELGAGRPVISLHYGYDLNNPKHSFRRGGSSYHMMVIVGFDDASEEFVINDPELRDGIDYKYKYATIMASLHDFNHTTHKADGPPTVLFTRPKQIVRVEGGHRIYLVRDGVKYYIAHPKVFNYHRWSWKLVKPMAKADLDALDTGAAITK